MSKTSQENKAKKALTAKEETEVKKTKSRKAKAEETEVTTPATEVTASSEEVIETTDATETPVEEAVKVKIARVRGKRYLSAKKKVGVDVYYPLKDAVKLVKETSISKFEGKVEAHVTVTEIGNLGEISFPHLETSSKRIVIVNDAVLAEIKDGKINFDILIATPITMPKLLPFARTLGPKGLMPNPKSGTLTDKPEEAVKKLSVAKTMIKTEKKAPVVHIVVGKVSQPAAELEANVAELIKVVKYPRMKKLSLCATMGPGVKVVLEK
jgi:large subunit ribosomal protein L1